MVTWTMKQLKTIGNKGLILALIQERKGKLNPYAPLAVRLRELAGWVELNIRG